MCEALDSIPCSVISLLILFDVRGMASLGKKCFWSELRVVIEMTEGRVEAGARRLGVGCKKKSKEADAARYWGKWC